MENKGDLRIFYRRVCDQTKWPRVWWQPKELQLRAFGEEADWNKVGDETFLIIRRTMFMLLGYCLFCWLALGAPDAKLIDASAAIKVPFANVEVGYTAFLLIGPILVIAIWSYLQVYVGIWSHIRRQSSFGSSLPFLFNLEGIFPHFFSSVLLYWIGPLTVGIFTWKALPRPEGTFLVFLSAAFFAGMFWLGICRRPMPRAFVKGLAGWGGLLCTLIVFVGWQDMQARFGIMSRSLSMAGENLEGKDLRNLNLSYADLQEAILKNSNLSNSNLNKANLDHADLSAANLSRANLNNAMLLWADLNGAVMSGAKFKRATLARTDLRAADMRGADLTSAILAYADLTSANLENANFEQTDLEDTNLSGVNLLGAKNLTRKQLLRACVEIGSLPVTLPAGDEFTGLKLRFCQ